MFIDPAPPPAAIEIEKITLLSVFRKKLLSWVDEHTARKFLLVAGEWFLFSMILSALVSPNFAYIAFKTLVFGANGFLIKFSLTFLFVRYRKWIWKKLKAFGRDQQNGQDLFDGIPVDELLHFLFETGGFKYNDSTKRFHIHKRIYERIAHRLEKLEILCRGENNSRVMNPEKSRQEIAALLKSGTGFRIRRAGEPLEKTKEDIDNELEQMLA